MLLWTRTGIVIAPLLAMVACITGLIGMHVIYTRWRSLPVVAATTAGLAALSWAGLAAGVSALAALRTGAPLFDAELARADAALHVDTQAVVFWIASIPHLGTLLDVAYVSTVPLIFAAAVTLAVQRREARMWELCFCFAGASSSSALFSAVMPAIGPFNASGTPKSISNLLPNGAGTFFVPTFEAFRNGWVDRVDVGHLEGVVSFPSFHAAMALMIAHAFRGRHIVAGLAWIWSALIIASAVPIGGHYFVDLLAGSMVWAVFALVASQGARAYCSALPKARMVRAHVWARPTREAMSSHSSGV